MKIIKLTAENVKKLKAVEIAPTGPLVEITGANDEGKSSVLDAIFYALAGTASLPSQPVRKGEEKAFVKLELGEITVIRRFTAAGGTSLVVEAANGARFPSPQTMLDQLMGKLSFDPLAFTRMDPKHQLESLRSVVKIELDIDRLDAETRTLQEARTEVNRTVKRLEAQLVSLDPPPSDTPDALVDINDLVAQLQKANEGNLTLAAERRRRADMDTEAGAQEIIAARLREEVTKIEYAAAQEAVSVKTKAAERRDQRIREAERDFQAEMDSLDGRLKGAANEVSDRNYRARVAEDTAEDLRRRIACLLSLPDDLDTQEFQERIAAAQSTNRQVEAKSARTKIASELEKAQISAESLTAGIANNTSKRDAAIASAIMPLPGLSMGAGEVMFDGLPLSQASSSEQLRVSVAIAMAANPKLRIIRIKDGSLLDDAGIETLRQTAQDNDYQVWIERVDTSGKVGIIMEDGTARVAPNLDAPETWNGIGTTEQTAKDPQ